MNLIIELNGNNIGLVLIENRKIIGGLKWEGEYSLSEMLIPNIDKLLKQNKISKKDVTEVKAKISKVSGVTSTRIVQTVVRAWNGGQKLGVRN